MSNIYTNISPIKNTNNVDLLNRNKNHHRSKSLNIQTLNNAFSELNVQSNIKHEKTSIEKINEIILGREKYFIPEKPALKINTRAQEKKSFKTPVSEVDFNELLKSLDDLTNVVKSNKNKIHKEVFKPENDVKKEEKQEKNLEEKDEEEKVEKDEKEEKVEEVVKEEKMEEEKTEEKEKVEEEKVEEEKDEEVDNENINKTTEQKLKNSASIKNFFNIKRINSDNNSNDNEENAVPGFSNIIQNSKNYLLNLASKKSQTNEEGITTEDNKVNIEDNKENVENKEITENSNNNENKETIENKESVEDKVTVENKEINENKYIENNEVIENKENNEVERIKGAESVNKNEKLEITKIKIDDNSRKLPATTVDKQLEITRNESENDEANNSRINKNENAINLYSKNRGSINVDVYMNSEMFPNTPVTPTTPDIPEKSLSTVQEVCEVNEVNKGINEEFNDTNKGNNEDINETNKGIIEEVNKKINEEANEENNVEVDEEDIPLQSELLKFNYGHRKSNSEVNIPTKKLNSSVRRSNSKDKLDILNKENVNPHFEGYTNMEYSFKGDTYEENELEEEEIESNPVRQDSMSYSKTHTLSNRGKNKSFLNQKNSNSNNLHKKTSQNRLSLNRSSINFQDVQSVNDLSNPPAPFYIYDNNVGTTKTINNEKGKDIYYIQRLNNENESYLDKEKDDNKAGTFNKGNNVAAIKLYHKTRKLSDVTSKHQRNLSLSSNHSLPSMNNNDSNYKYDRINISPNLLSKKNVSPISTKSPNSFNNNSAVGSPLMDQSLNANDKELINENNEKSTVLSENDENKEKAMNNIEVMKFDVHGRNYETKEETKEEENNVFMSNWTKPNNQHNDQENPDHSVYVASPERVKYQSAIIYSKRNSSFTKFSIVNPRTRNMAGNNISMKSKYYRYSMARNMQTYHNVADKGPVPSHHTKLTIPHFNPNIIPEQPEQPQEQQIHKESLENDSSQSTLLMEGTIETNEIKSISNSNNDNNNNDSNNNDNDNNNDNNNNDSNNNDNNNNDDNVKKSFLFRDNRENNKSHVNNIKSEIEHIQEETNELTNEFNNDESQFNNRSYDPYPISNSVPINMSSILYDSVENDYHRNKQNNLQIKFKNSKSQPEIIKTINGSTIPFMFSKEQSDWDTNMHTMSLYDEDNPKPRKSRKSFRKTFSIFKKKN